MPTLITAGGASDSLAITAGNDGALTIQTGPSGAKVNALAFASDGTPTFLKNIAQPQWSQVSVNTSNAFGSTNTMIRKFANVTNGVNGCVIQGTDITFVNDAANGASFTINTAGLYAISYCDQSSATNFHGLSRNATGAELTTTINTLSIAKKLAQGSNPAASVGGMCSWQGNLAAADIIRPHTAAGATGSFTEQCLFTIVRVA